MAKTAEAKPIRVHYLPKGTFQVQLQGAVSDCVQQISGARRRLWVKGAIVSAWFYLSLLALLFFHEPTWVDVGLTVSLGLAGAGTLMTIVHDAVHGTFSDRRAVNILVASLAEPFGISRAWWHAKHNVFHHGFTNVDGFDNDIALGRLARLSPAQVWCWWHRYQHVYLWLAYPWLYFAMLFHGDAAFITRGQVGSRNVAVPTAKRTLCLIGEKVLGLAVVLGTALALRPWYAVAGCFLGAGLVCGFVLAVTFQIEHVVDTTSYPAPDLRDGSLGTEWARAQVLGAADVATGNRLYTWYVGGLNYHIEHHLFPRLPHVVLPNIAPLVRTACAEYGIIFSEFPTVSAAVRAHQRMLRRLGAPPAPPVSVLHEVDHVAKLIA